MQHIMRDFAILDDAIPPRRAKVYKTRYDPFQLAEHDFYSRYRFDKATVLFLIEILNIEEPINNRGLPISAGLQVLTALRFLGRNVHQSDIAGLQVLTALRFLGRNVHQSDIGDLHGMSQCTVGRIIKNVSKKIALLLPHFITYPTNQELADVKSNFNNVSRFPAIIGAIDCTHVRIKCPAKCVGAQMAGHYLNRKGCYSLNVQIVCDANCKILDIVARSRGSKHDARIWNECNLKSKLERTRSSHNGVLLGDGGYPLSPILLTPVRNPSTPKEERHNRSHIATRTKIKCLNGQMKSKFRSIFERLRVDLDTAKNVIVAVAVLHNIAKERNLSFLDDESSIAPIESANLSTSENIPSTTTGRAFRAAFINTHF